MRHGADPRLAARDWLARYVRTEWWWSQLTSVLAGIAVPVVFVLTWAILCFVWLFLLLVLHRVLLLGWWAPGLVSVELAVALGTLTIVGATVAFLVAERRCRALEQGGGGMGWAAVILSAALRFIWFVEFWPYALASGRAGARTARDDDGTAIGFALSLLFFGPGLFASILVQADRRRALRAIDLDACAAVIARCYDAGKRQSFEELGAALPHVGIGATLNDLRLVRGVVFLAAPPPALALGERMRADLDAACAGYLPTELRDTLAA